MTNLVDTIAALEAERDHLRVEVERKHERITHLDARLEAEVEFRGTLIDMIAKLIADRDRMVNAITAANVHLRKQHHSNKDMAEAVTHAVVGNEVAEQAREIVDTHQAASAPERHRIDTLAARIAHVGNGGARA